MDDQPDDSFEPVPEPLPKAPVAAVVPEKTPAPEASPVPEGPISKEPEPPHHSWIYHVFNFLLGAKTPVGRVTRPVLRWLATVVGLVALVLMAGYLLLYQPTQNALVASQQQNAALSEQIKSLQDQVAGLQNTLTAANQSVKTAQDAATKAQARNTLLIVVYDIANARTYLAQKDGANLMKTLNQARADLDFVLPYLQSAKPDLADELNSRLETVRSVVVRDATLAQSDLDNLYTALTSANNLLFGTNP
jgi:hypothetical protein